MLGKFVAKLSLNCNQSNIKKTRNVKILWCQKIFCLEILLLRFYADPELYVLLYVNLFELYSLKESFIYTRCGTLLSGASRVVFRPPHLTLACAEGHAATFVVNAALVASQWQHLARNLRS